MTRVKFLFKENGVVLVRYSLTIGTQLVENPVKRALANKGQHISANQMRCSIC